jgi:hypothetical protein
MPHTGSSGASGGDPVTPGDVYISSAVTIKGVPEAAASNLRGRELDFLSLFVSTLLTKKYSGEDSSPYEFNPDLTNSNRVPEKELDAHISFSQAYSDSLTDFVHPWVYPYKGKTYLHLENKSKRVLLRRDKSKKKAQLLKLVNITPSAVPFEIQIRSNDPPEIRFPTDLQVDYILYYLAKVGYSSPADAARIQKAFQDVYIYLFSPTVSTADDDVADVGSLEINFTPPVQIGVNDKNCGGYTIPGSDKRTAIAVLHDKVECLAALINDISSNPITGSIFPQYVAYDHGLVPDLESESDIQSLPPEPVNWRDWYLTPANNPTATRNNSDGPGPYGADNDMIRNLQNWVNQGKVLVFKSPLGAGTLSIYLTGFPFANQLLPGQSNEEYPEANDGAFIRLCNGNNPYDAMVNPHNGNSAYDDRFIFYDKYYRVLANITPGESVRVTWCASQATPGWISIVGT